MDDYVIVINPNNHIVLGVNEDKMIIIKIEETYSDEPECFYPSDGQIMGITIFTLMIITTSVVYA